MLHGYDVWKLSVFPKVFWHSSFLDTGHQFTKSLFSLDRQYLALYFFYPVSYIFPGFMAQPVSHGALSPLSQQFPFWGIVQIPYISIIVSHWESLELNGSYAYCTFLMLQGTTVDSIINTVGVLADSRPGKGLILSVLLQSLVCDCSFLLVKILSL